MIFRFPGAFTALFFFLDIALLILFLDFFSHFVDQLKYRSFDLAAFPVVRRNDAVHTVVLEQALCDFRILVVDPDGMASVFFCQLHTGHIRDPVADIDHMREGNAFILLGHMFIQQLVLIDIQHTFIDAVDKLRF